MMRALQLAGKAGQVKFVGFDVNQTLLEGLKKGEIHGFAVQDPIKIGYEGVKTAVAVIEGKPYEKIIDTGVKMVTKDNLEEPEVIRLLNPQPDKYLNQ
jgi:ribose transport system substrate-binding protein